MSGGSETSTVGNEAYVRYTLEFFRRWLPYYDLFAGSIFFAYEALVREVGAREGQSLLDICTGTGQVSLRCARRGSKVVGFDLSPDMLRKAQAKSRARGLEVALARGDARRIPFPDKSFDTVTISFALHDMPRGVRLMVLAEAARVARQRLLILDYDLPSWKPARALGRAAIDLFESPYYKSFVQEGAEAIVRSSGLKVLRRTTFGGGFFTILDVERPDSPGGSLVD